MKKLHDLPGLQLPVQKDYAKNVYWMFNIVLKGGLAGKRKFFIDALKAKGIETRESFIPFNMQNIFIGKGLTKKEDCPLANYVAENGFYIPSGPILTDEEKQYVANSMEEVCGALK